MDGGDVVLFLAQLVLEIVDAALRVSEHEHLIGLIPAEKLLERADLVLLEHLDVDLVDAVDVLLLGLDRDLDGVVAEPRRRLGHVGTTTRACGLFNAASTFSRMGIANAAVLPVPVCAWAKRSRPACRTGIASVCTGVGAMKPSSSMAREMSGWIASSPKRAVGGARVNVSPVLIYMLTGETLAVNELFQRKSIQFGDDLLRISLRSGTWVAGG